MSGGVPAGPLEADQGGFMPRAKRAAILAGVLDGVELGAWGRRVAGWLTGLDTSAAAGQDRPGGGRRRA